MKLQSITFRIFQRQILKGFFDLAHVMRLNKRIISVSKASLKTFSEGEMNTLTF